MRPSVLIIFLAAIFSFSLLSGCGGDKLPPCNATCSSRGYECGSHVVCYSPVSCGTCDDGDLCVKGTCKEMGRANTYFVAVDGNDSNPGTISQPWATFQHAIYLAKPGDTVYLRGGVYYHNDSLGGDPSSGVGYSGTPEAWIRFWNYPGERPIFDFGNHTVDEATGWTGSIGWNKAQYIHLRGFTVRNVHQTPPDFSRKQKPHSEGHGLSCSSCANFIYENIVVHDIDGRGFQHWTGAWNGFDATDAVEKGYQQEYQAPEFASDTTYFINCDAYNLYDRYAATPGNAADGWKIESYAGNTFVWEGCRAWNYSDDGFDPHGSGKRVFKSNWAMPTDKYEGLSDDWSPEANGFKTTAFYLNDTSDDQHGVIFDRNIAAFGTGSGFIVNLALDFDSRFPTNPLIYNNLAYQMGIGFTDSNRGGNVSIASSTYRNNIAYDAQSIEATGTKYEVYLYSVPTIESHNTWIGHPRSGDWWWKYNTDYNVTDEDFISLDYRELAAPRRSDFTLPDIAFGHLAPGSDLIDAGMVIPSYHCATPGLHPGEDCVAWTGAAPDLGPFEYGLEQETVCRGPITRPCAMKDAYAEQTRTCIGPGEWSDFGACEFVACDIGYVRAGDVCVIGLGWSKELVYNGGFEGSVGGWTRSSDDWASFAYQIWGAVHIPQDGHFCAYIAANSSADGYLYQDVDLTAYVAYVDAGRVVANVSGWAISTAAFAAENAIRFQFLDGAKAVISTPLDTGYVRNPAWWEARLSEEPVPAGTRYLRVWANSKDTYNMGLASGDLDSFSVKVKVLER